MKDIPFDKFIVESNGVNVFHVTTAQPSMWAGALHAAQSGIVTLNDPATVETCRLARLIFIHEAIQEKIDREMGK